MAYERLNLKQDDLLDEAVFKKIDDNFDKVPVFSPMSAADFGKQLFVNQTGDGFLLVGNTTVVPWENLVNEAELYRPGYIAGKGVTQSNGTVLYQAASSFYSAINIPVKENTKYYLGGPNTGGLYARFVNWQSDKYTGLSATGTITSMTNEQINAVTISMTGARSVENITSPAGAKYCTVVFYDPSQGGTETNYFTTIANPEDRIDKVINNSLEIADSGKWNLLETAEAHIGNWFYTKKISGNYQGGGFHTWYNIPIKAGTTYYLGPDFNGQYARCINWSTDKYVIDSSCNIAMTDTEISAITRSASMATKAEAHTAPIGAKYCTVSFYVGYGDVVTDSCYFTVIENSEDRKDAPPTYRVSTQGVSQETLDLINDIAEETQSISDVVPRVHNMEEYSFVQKRRQHVINFQFDDAILAGDSICKEIFEEYGYKCDFAVTSKISGDTLIAYLQFQKEGFGILCHSVDGSGMGSVADDADMQLKIDKMQQSYTVLKEKGFDIHGWVTPSSGLHDSLYEPLSKIYDYGFGTGQSSSVYHKFGEERYIHHMSRVGIESNVILKASTNTSACNKVMTYLNNAWGVTCSADTEYTTVTINNASFDALVSTALADSYEDVAIVDGTINDAGITYLQDIWGVSVADSTLIIDTENATLSLTPTWKTCCVREGMKNIRNYIDTAIAQNAFLAFYAHNTYSEDGADNGYGINLSKYTREILRYCQKVGARVMNAKDGIRDYFSFRYTDFLELKSSIS